MAWSWLHKIVMKIAAEVHKTKIEEFEKRLLEIEKQQQVILKSIKDNEDNISKLDNRVYDANIKLATLNGVIDAVITNRYINPKRNNNG